MSNLSFAIEYRNRLLGGAVIFVALAVGVACDGVISKPIDVKHSITQDSKRGPSATNVPDPDAEQLALMYAKKDCSGFVAAFPGSYEEFARLYRYGPGLETLFPRYEEHFRFFINCDGVENEEKIRRVIGISAASKWDEDVPSGQFGEIVYDLVLKNSGTVSVLLNGISDEKAASFWHFLFDRPHPKDKENVERVTSLIELLGNDTRQGKLLAQQHEQLVRDWKDH